MATKTDDDPIRDLNNYLQEVKKGENLTKDLSFTSQQARKNDTVVHTGTYTFRGVAVGSGTGTSISAAKRGAAKEALNYFHKNGIEGIP